MSKFGLPRLMDISWRAERAAHIRASLKDPLVIGADLASEPDRMIVMAFRSDASAGWGEIKPVEPTAVTFTDKKRAPR
jgi:hypothetical protein